MDVKTRINAFAALGNQLQNHLTAHRNGQENPLSDVMRLAHHKNGWFDTVMIEKAIQGITEWLTIENLEAFTAKYIIDCPVPKKVGVIMAGNIPLVGFHDYLCVLLSGHHLLAKVSSKDEVLLKFIHQELVGIEGEWNDKVTFTDAKMEGLEAIIATGSDNSAKYFEYYFGALPKIIRKNRTSIAVLNGSESVTELQALGEDIFTYYGLGCRNVTKLYVPASFKVDWLYEGLFTHGAVINHHKYQNNYDYHKSVFLLNQDQIWDNNFLLLKEDSALASPVGVIYFERYTTIEELEITLASLKNDIQCRVGVNGLKLGEAQQPTIFDYADNIDTMEFLSDLDR